LCEWFTDLIISVFVPLGDTNIMWAAFLLGLAGSLGHCVGMCSGIALLLSRRGQAGGWRLLFLHGGRLTTYSLMGAFAGSLGYTIMMSFGYAGQALSGAGDTSPNDILTGLHWIQGGLALFTAVISLYMALALLGRLPSPELLFANVTHTWGRLMRRVTAVTPSQTSPVKKTPLIQLLGMGMLWGTLPCGLVMAAVVTAAASGSPQLGALTMLAFGLGTLPVTMSISLITHLKAGEGSGWRRPHFQYAAALLILVFGVQMSLRGLAAWGWIDHFHLGAIMLW